MRYQVTIGRGSTARRVICWLDHGQVGVRLPFSNRWLSLYWWT
jgi:hypothetical protein